MPFTRTTLYGAIRAATGFIPVPWTFLKKQNALLLAFCNLTVVDLTCIASLRAST
jgi:hypothetical protein